MAAAVAAVGLLRGTQQAPTAATSAGAGGSARTRGVLLLLLRGLEVHHRK